MNLPKWMFEGIVTSAIKDNYDTVSNLISEEEYDYLRSPLFVDWLYYQRNYVPLINLTEYSCSEEFVKYLIKQYNIFSTSIPDYEVAKWYKSRLTDEYVYIKSVNENGNYNVLVVLDDLYINDIVTGDKYHYYFVHELMLITDSKELDEIYNKLDKMRDVEFDKVDAVKTRITEIEKIMEWC